MTATNLPWEGTQPSRNMRLVSGCFVLMLVSATFLQRFVIQLGRPLPVALFVGIGCIALLMATGRVTISPTRLATYAAMAAAITVPQIYSIDQDQFFSLMMLLTFYSIFIFVHQSDRSFFHHIMSVHQKLVLVIAILGIIQFFAQFAIPGPRLFTFSGLVPDQFLREFNTLNTLHYGSTIYKNNGVFLLEASDLSQMMGRAILFELLFFRVGWRAAIYGLSMLLSYSGTGLLLLFFFLPVVLSLRLSLRVVLLCLFGALVILISADALNLDVFLARVREFETKGSSAFARFLSPFYMIGQFQLSDPVKFLFGLGSGTLDAHVDAVRYAAFGSTWGKLFLEYGLVGSVAFYIFIAQVLFAHPHSRLVNAILFFCYLVLSGSLLLIQNILFLYLMSSFSVPPHPGRAAMRTVPAHRFV